MKQIIFITIIIIGLGTVILYENTQAHLGASIGFGVFYSALEPYGEWIAFDGILVWRPLHVRYGWRPYLHGRWIWTNYGWYWYSYEPFGWATFHYGRWYYDDYYGWIWIPDHIWGPAWVEWRYSHDYIGWAPLPPHIHFSIHIGISSSPRWVAPIHYWNFIPCDRFISTRVADYVQPIERTRRIFGNTRSILNIKYENGKVVNHGIDTDLIEKHTRKRINRADVIPIQIEHTERIKRKNQRDRIEVFQPRFDTETRDELSRPKRIRQAERSLQIDGIEYRKERDEPPQLKRESAIQKDKFYDSFDHPSTKIERNRQQERERTIELEKSKPERSYDYPKSRRDAENIRTKTEVEKRPSNQHRKEFEQTRPRNQPDSPTPRTQRSDNKRKSR